MSLRLYQQAAIDAMWRGFENGNVLIEVPTAGGKSHIIAGFCERALREFPDTKILMLVHRKELVEQNAQKMRPLVDCDVAIYCAALKRKEIGQLTFASVQSLARSKDLDQFDLILVDECHRIPLHEGGQYRSVMARAGGRVAGFTATPYRLQGGVIHGADKLFPKVSYRVSVKYLLEKEFLTPVVGFKGRGDADLSGVRKGSNGDYKEGELQDAFENEDLVQESVEDMLEKSSERKSIIVFATGVRHAEMICSELRAKGESPMLITGETDQQLRDSLTVEFKAGHTRILVNVGVFTEGFDAPNVDCVVLMRATLSPGLYAQMVGRGMRLFPGKADCMLLDYGGNVLRHGPIDNVLPPPKAREKRPATTKVCPMCEQLVPVRKRQCDCGFEFPASDFVQKAKHHRRAGDVDPMKPENLKRWTIEDVEYRKHQKAGKPPCLLIQYTGGMLGRYSVREFVCLEHGGRATREARKWLARRGIMPLSVDTVSDVLREISTRGILEPSHAITNHVGKWPELVDVAFEGCKEKRLRISGNGPVVARKQLMKLFS